MPDEAPAPKRNTLNSVVGERIDGDRTAFHPDSGTLGIPRSDMPQINPESRGGAVSFLRARGIKVSTEDELPGNLKPSQADFHPSKVERAGDLREAASSSPERSILTSSDGHVIDGHHQWLDRLANTPDKPMATLRIDAPARDILKQIHELPSAKMGKALDLDGDSARARKQVAELSAKEKTNGGFLAPQERDALRSAREIVGRDDNRQALGANPQPASPAGKAARQRIESYEAAQQAGAKLNASQHASWRNSLQILENDFTAQRLALENPVSVVSPTSPVEPVREAKTATGETKAPVSETKPPVPATKVPVGETPSAPAKPPRSFKMPHAAEGGPDVLDLINEQGGMVSPARAKASGKVDRLAGDYDGAPTLGGFYHHAVYKAGSRTMPDQMAKVLHEEHGIGDSSVDGMWKAIGQARELRDKVRERQQTQKVQEKQAGRFDKDALQASTAKGKTEVNTSSLSVGDHIQIGDQNLRVKAIDPDTMDVELEDHSKYGVQRVADGEALYVEKVTPGPNSELADGESAGDKASNAPVADAAPTATAEPTQEAAPRVVAPGRLGDHPRMAPAREWLADQRAAGKEPSFGDLALSQKLPFKEARQIMMDQTEAETKARIQQSSEKSAVAPQTISEQPSPKATGELKEPSEQVSTSIRASVEPTASADALPTLRIGENQGDLLSKQTEDLKLVGEEGVDHARREFERRKAERETAEAKAKQDREQSSLFAAKPTEEAEHVADGRELTDRADATPEDITLPRGEPITPKSAETVTKAYIGRFRGQLARLGVDRVAWGETRSASGLEFRDDGTMGIDSTKLARSLEKVRDLQESKKMDATPEDWLAQAITHEAIHGAQFALAREKGLTLPDLYNNSLPEEAMPQGWREAGRRTYGPEWESLPDWAKKAEHVRQVIEGRWTGRITEQVYKFARDVVEYLKKIAGLHGTDPRFRAHIEELDQRISSLREGMEPGDGAGSGDALFAAAPADEDHAVFSDKPAEDAKPPSSLLDRIRGKIGEVRDKVAASREQSATEEDIAAGRDAVETRASDAGVQAGTAVRLDLPEELDRQAASAVTEAAGNRQRLEADLAKVKGSADPKLAEEFAPIYQHALDNLDRLHGAADGYRSIEAGEVSAAQKEGLEGLPWQPYTERVHDNPELGESVVQGRNLRMSRGHKSIADGLAAGVRPDTMDLAKIAEHQVRRNQEAVNEVQFRKAIADIKASDGKPLLSTVTETQSKKSAAGNIQSTQTIPKNYMAVQAGDNVLVIHREFAPIIRALYADSAVRENALGNSLFKLAAFAKHNSLILDSYHLGRLAAKAASLGLNPADYQRGLVGHKYRIEDLDRAVEAGEVSEEHAQYTREAHADMDALERAGVNVGKVADNLLEAAHAQSLFQKLPVVGPAALKFNDFLFSRFQRGAVRQASVVILRRNRARFPELSEPEVLRRSVRETNQFFGNLGRQGIFKSQTMRDVASMVGFAPQWAESQFKSEAQGIGQMARIPLDVAQGKGLRAGNIAQAMAGMVLASAAGAQMLNILTKGHPTWKNEEGHQMDAWIPGGPNNRGFWFSPLSIAGEYTHALTRYMEGGESALDAVAHVASNKLSGPARAAKDLLGGKDWKGQPFGSTGERLTAAATDALPSPLPLSGFIQKDPTATLGYKLNDQPGSLEKQALGMVGLKVDAAQSPRSQMFKIAQKYRAGGPTPANQPHAPSAYGDLRRMLDSGNLKGAAGEITRLRDEVGKPPEKIASALGLVKDGTTRPELFTGSAESERKMLAALSPDQKKVYAQAQKDHALNARKLLWVMQRMPKSRLVTTP